MAVTYIAWDGEEFSWAWYWILRAAVADGVLKITDINDGHRSMALQAERVRQFGLWSLANPTGAAAPSPDAPHILVGRPNHALDVQTTVIQRLVDWLARHRVFATRPISTEPWHLWVDNADALVRFARECHERLRAPRYSDRERKLLAGRRTRRNRLALRTQARAVQVAARKPRRLRGGWDRYDRSKRFAGLRKAALT